MSFAAALPRSGVAVGGVAPAGILLGPCGARALLQDTQGAPQGFWGQQVSVLEAC
jgi:hypothetical protein